ncbi:MAG: tRNA-intron lyase, partial [Euryarchaeota archaeon CG01_land_8_20_14_3_00_38_12]
MGELINYATKTYPQFEIKYIVYRDFRQRGYIVKPDNEGIDFKAYKRGDAPNKANAKFWVSAVSERAKFSISNLSEMVDKA